VLSPYPPHPSRSCFSVAVLAVLAALVTVPGCLITPKPATPTLIGPDTGWTKAPTVFTATGRTSDSWWTWVTFYWGDSTDENSTTGDRYTHVYAEPGTYVVRCRSENVPDIYRLEFGGARGSDWSNPCTVHIVPDTITHPDSVYATVEFPHGINWTCALPNGGAVYATCSADSSVYVLNPATNTCTGRIAVGPGPTCCITSAAGDKLYVSIHGGNVVSVIETATNTVVDSIPLPAAPDGLALLPGDSILYVSHSSSNEVSVVRLSDDSVVAQVAVRDSPCGMTVTPDGGQVFVACMGNDSIAVINTAGHFVEKACHAGNRPTSILFSPSGETAYVAVQLSRQVALFRTSDLVKFDSCGLDLYAQYLVMLPGNRCLYVVSPDGYSSRVSVLRRSDNCLLRQLILKRPGAPSVLPDGSHFYVPNANFVSVLGPSAK